VRDWPHFDRYMGLKLLVRIRRDLESGKVIPSGDLWPRFLYQGYKYNSNDPWDGLLRSSLLVKVSRTPSSTDKKSHSRSAHQAYKHVFTSPSSAYGDGDKATRSSNARIHGMTSVTPASLAYIATQVSRFLT
jgi:hypothetical protein